MYKYPKIETLYARATNGSKKLIEGEFLDETVAFLADIPWHATEKIDGTNIGVYWDGHEVHFQGRTERTVIPAHLQERLEELFGGETNAQIFEQLFGEKEVVLFGEGYGHKIQAAGDSYDPDGANFVLFDIYVPLYNMWLVRSDMCNIAEALGIEVVPWLGTAPLKDWVEYVKEKNHSLFADDDDYIMEGVVCKPAVELRNKRGERIVVKIKWRDFE
jgi:ATP-dependent RNA circularization protein (DNA/RNA ligase family)